LFKNLTVSSIYTGLAQTKISWGSLWQKRYRESGNDTMKILIRYALSSVLLPALTPFVKNPFHIRAEVMPRKG